MCQSADDPSDVRTKVVPTGARRKHLIGERCSTTRTSGNVSGTIFIDTNLWMDIYVCIFPRGPKTGYRARNSNTDAADAVTLSSADSATEYGCDSM